MEFDDLSFDRRGAPHLVEVAAEYAGGQRVGRRFWWHTGRIGAVVRGKRVVLKRRLGVVSEGLTLVATELAPLSAACEHWATERDEWSEFFFSCSGYPPGCGLGAWRHWPAGRGATWQTVSRDPRKSPFRNEPETRHRKPPPAIAKGVVLVAESWQAEPSVGVREPVKVGQSYELAGGLKVDAERGRLCVRRGGEDVTIEPDEEAFLRELRDVNL